MDHDEVLNHCDFFCRRTFRSLLDVKGYPVTVVEGFKTVSIDRRMMNENICSIFLLNESESFVVAEPLNNSIGHDNILLSYLIFNVANWRGAILANGFFLQRGAVLKTKRELTGLD